MDTLSACATIVQMTLLSLIVAGVMLAHQHLEQVFPRLLLLLGVMIVHAGLVWVREMTVQYGAIRCKNAVRQRVFAHLFLLGPAYYKGESTGELVTVLNEGIERLDTYVSRSLPQLAASVLVPLLLVAAIFPLDWVSGVLLLVTGPIIPLLMMLVGSFAERHIQRQWQALARMGATLLDAIQGLSTLKLFGQSEAATKGIVQISDRFRAKTLKVLRVAFLSGAVLEFIVGMLASAAFCIYPLVRPAVNKANSLTIQNASAPAYAQTIGLAWWSFSMLLAMSYFITTYLLFWGKVGLSSREGY